MKTKFLTKATVLSVLVLAVTSLSSCLKDSRYVDIADSPAVVELPLSAGSGVFESVGFNIVNTPTDLPVTVNLAGPSTLGSNLTVTFKIDAASLAAYNTANGTSYTLLPTADYSISSLAVTIPAGSRTAILHVAINSSLIDLTKQFVLPLTIADASGQLISANYATLLYNVLAKNAYDANYTETGYKFHTTVGASHALSGTIAVSTAGAVTCKTAVGDLGGSNYYFDFDVSSTNTLINYVPIGSTPAAPASGFMTVDVPAPGGALFTTDSTIGLGTQPGTAPYVSTTYNNTYDPTKKIFWLHYGYGVGTTSQLSYSRQFYAKLVSQ